MGVRREERRLLERVEQDQRDAQQRLEQLRRENGAATRVAQSLLDQRLQRVAHLRQQVQQCGAEAMRTDTPEVNPRKDELLKNVSEVLQPWEISLSLKRVTFKPSSQAKPISFGEIKIQEHNLSFPVGGCGAQGQLCALHASGGHYVDSGISTQDCRGTPEGAGAGQGQSQVVAKSSTSGNTRVVRKLRLSARSDEESGEEMKRLSSRLQKWPPKRDSSERDSSQDEEQESPTSDPRGDCLFLAVPNLIGNGDSEGEDLGNSRTGKMHRHNLRDKRSQLSHREPSPFLEQSSVGQDGWYFRSFDTSDSNRDRRKGRQDSPRSLSRFGYGTSPTSPRGSPRDSLSSHSCMDLSSRDRPRSRLSACSDDHPHGTYGEMGGRASSPTDSVDSGYTFIISSPRDYASSVRQESRLSKSTVDLSQRSRPLINGSQGDNAGLWKVNRSSFSSSSASPSLGKGLRRTVGRAFSCTATKEPGTQRSKQHKGQRDQSRVSRSLSMSVIDGSSQDGLGFSSGSSNSQPKERRLNREGMNEPVLVEELEEQGELVTLGEGRLVRQFGKQGSGRADLTLPSGVHATVQGQLFVVDCGNARVQVTDAVGNVMQQIKSSSNGSGTRRCRNYFDVAVNAKGLIAVSCAAERALLIFNRHGRLLQTFGGSPAPGTTAASSDGLEAPRGVTVTKRDEFLVADIRKGTLTAMKLDPKTGSRLERTVVTGFHRPYLVAASQHSDLLAVSERGSETGREPCVKVLDSGWTTVRVLGVCSGMGPVLSCPWGICIDRDGEVLVADWAQQHRVVLYPAQGVGRTVVSRGLSSPRGLTLLPDGSLVVSDSMHHCIKVYKYK